MDPLSLQVLLGQLDKVAKIEDLTKERAFIHRNSRDDAIKKRSLKDTDDVPETKHIVNSARTGTHAEEHNRTRKYAVKKSRPVEKKSKSGRFKRHLREDIGRMIDIFCIFE